MEMSVETCSPLLKNEILSKMVGQIRKWDNQSRLTCWEYIVEHSFRKG